MLCLLLWLPATRATASPVGWFVSPRRAKTLISGGALVLDARSAAAYRRGHLRGAVHAPWERFSGRGPAARRGELAPLRQLRKKLRALGVSQRRTVLVLGAPRQGWGEEGRIAWMLRVLGHRRTAIVDGGYDALRALAVAETRAPPAVAAGDFVPRRPQASWIDTPDVRKRLREGRTTFVDTRESREFRGATPYGEARGGHLPGAIHLHYRKLLRRDGRLKPAAALREILRRAGINERKSIVAYCTGGVRSAWLVAVLSHLGYRDVRNYAGSMWAWAAASAATHPLVR